MVQQQVFELIKAAMPEGSEVDVDSEYTELDVRLSWKIGDDPERPNRRSKTIRITMIQETADDIDDATALQQAAALERIAVFLRSQFDALDPQHGSPRDQPPPMEHWVITHQVALGNQGL